MQVEFIRTVVCQDQASWVDLIRVDGQLYTQLLVKAVEADYDRQIPPTYKLEKQQQGDVVDQFLEQRNG